MSDDLVVIGKVTRTHGVHGEVRVLPYSAEVDSLNHYERLYFQTTNGARELLTIDSLRPHKNFALLKLKEVHGAESAKRLIGADVLINATWFYFASASLPELVFHFEKPALCDLNFVLHERQLLVLRGQSTIKIYFSSFFSLSSSLSTSFIWEKIFSKADIQFPIANMLCFPDIGIAFKVL